VDTLPGGLLRAHGGRRFKNFRVLCQQTNKPKKERKEIIFSLYKQTKQTNKQTNKYCLLTRMTTVHSVLRSSCVGEWSQIQCAVESWLFPIPRVLQIENLFACLWSHYSGLKFEFHQVRQMYSLIARMRFQPNVKDVGKHVGEMTRGWDKTSMNMTDMRWGGFVKSHFMRH